MALEHDIVGSEIVDWLLSQHPDFTRDTSNPARLNVPLQLPDTQQTSASYNLTPVDVPMEVADASSFQQVKTIDELISQYWSVRNDNPFEHDIPGAMDNIHPWADEFLEQLMANAASQFDDQDAQLIAQLASTLDIYTAIKTIESLLNDPQDITLLKLAKQNNWQAHLDHIVIRCGNQKHEDGERLFNFLMKYHHYYPPQHIEDAYLLSNQGWNAYPLYKVMVNGQMIRIFIDQSDSEHKQHAIQHWNHSYGYTPHHIGLRFTTKKSNSRIAVPLPAIINELQKQSILVFNPAKLTTTDLLQNVLIKPHKLNHLPDDIMHGLAEKESELTAALTHGKLIGLVSRLELPENLKQKWFRLYQIAYDSTNPIHSVPAFNLFSPVDSSNQLNLSEISSAY